MQGSLDPDGESLRLVVEQVRASMAGCEAAAVTVVHGDEPVMVVGTSLLGCELEEAQWAAGHGPGIDALRQLQVFNVTCLATARSWPDFTRTALGRGVRSTLAVPLTGKGRALGVLNLYAPEVDAFVGHEPIALRYASEAASLLAGAEWIRGVRPPCVPGTAGGPGMVPAVS